MVSSSLRAAAPPATPAARIEPLAPDALEPLVAAAIDRDAAGHGWFIDPTPLEDNEFERLLVEDVLHARASGGAAERMDLPTVVLHELGHLAGFEHTSDGDDLLAATLGLGQRRLPKPRLVDEAMADLGAAAGRELTPL